jgi:transposase InsO family protein
MWLVLLRSKDEAVDATKQVRAHAEGTSGRKLGYLRTDRGGGFLSPDFSEYCVETGVRRHLTTPYSPQQNIVVECYNQLVVAMMQSMMKVKNLLGFFWSEVVTTVVNLLNMSPTQSVEGMTPYKAWHGTKSSLAHLRTFGCIVHTKNTKPHMSKLDNRSTRMIFIGYESGSKAY